VLRRVVKVALSFCPLGQVIRKGLDKFLSKPVRLTMRLEREVSYPWLEGQLLAEQVLVARWV
jgi:hypothetical protein